MGLSDREYMRTPDEPGLSNFAWGVIGLVGLAILVLFLRSRSQPFQYDEQLEEQMIELTQLTTEAAVGNLISTPHGLLPRVTDAMADGIINV